MDNFIGDNINALRIDRGLSQEKLAEIANVTQQTVSSWENGGSTPRKAAISRIISYYPDLTFDSIMSKENGYAVKVFNRGGEERGLVDVPVVASIAAGKPMDIMEIDDTIPIRTSIWKKHPNSAWFKVEGNSYTEGGLHNGMYALVDFDMTDIVPDIPYAIQVNERVTMKAVEELENGLKLIPKSYDPTYRPIVFDYAESDTDEVKVLGRVVHAAFPDNWGF